MFYCPDRLSDFFKAVLGCLLLDKSVIFVNLHREKNVYDNADLTQSLNPLTSSLDNSPNYLNPQELKRLATNTVKDFTLWENNCKT